MSTAVPGTLNRSSSADRISRRSRYHQLSFSIRAIRWSSMVSTGQADRTGRGAFHRRRRPRTDR
ncbi:hypothetical protein ACFQY7_33765 [Actinomadura luteofluorescens]|uniref:hypothetical protein n=1 Tax=Actinomadura luteofluorescens TaxID=46163 RepID=UPI003630C3CF